MYFTYICFFFFQAEDGIRYHCVTGVQTCALPISSRRHTRSLCDWSSDVCSSDLLPWLTAIMVGGAISMSSTAILLQQLTERAELNRTHGRLAFSMLLF